MQQVIAEEEGIEVQVGTGVDVYIAKDFGPACFDDLKVKAVVSTHVNYPDCWVVERLNREGEWAEVLRLPAISGK